MFAPNMHDPRADKRQTWTRQKQKAKSIYMSSPNCPAAWPSYVACCAIRHAKSGDSCLSTVVSRLRCTVGLRLSAFRLCPSDLITRIRLVASSRGARSASGSQPSACAPFPPLRGLRPRNPRPHQSKPPAAKTYLRNMRHTALRKKKWRPVAASTVQPSAEQAGTVANCQEVPEYNRNHHSEPRTREKIEPALTARLKAA